MTPPARRPARPKAASSASSPAAAPAAEPFWRTTPLSAMNAAQWESLCDGCGRCCLVKLEDEDSGAIAYTDVACQLFDAGSCRCADYANRSERVADCVRLTPEAVEDIGWLPPTCAYRLVRDGQDLPFWHPLVSGDPQSVVRAGVSVMGKVSGLESEFGLFELVDHIVAWPARWPRGAKGAVKGAAKAPAKVPAKTPPRRRAKAGPEASE
ncbi:YcgN family cysteine cluster protein [Xanthobacter autotrophicus DSM 431]|uniref:YcgN family cysteine cluster protein n=1 Tax=Xanthobacter nonsaccharivorans TaxID=3119912 RepID=UPI00372863D1